VGMGWAWVQCSQGRGSVSVPVQTSTVKCMY